MISDIEASIGGKPVLRICCLGSSTLPRLSRAACGALPTHLPKVEDNVVAKNAPADVVAAAVDFGVINSAFQNHVPHPLWFKFAHGLLIILV